MEDKITKAIVNNLKAKKNVVGIVLFGSQARGASKPISDTDIAVILNKYSEEDVYEIEAHSSKNVDVVVFNELPPIFKMEIVKEHKILYCKNESKLRHIFMRAAFEYIEHKPLYEMLKVSK